MNRRFFLWLLGGIPGLGWLRKEPEPRYPLVEWSYLQDAGQWDLYPQDVIDQAMVDYGFAKDPDSYEVTIHLPGHRMEIRGCAQSSDRGRFGRATDGSK